MNIPTQTIIQLKLLGFPPTDIRRAVQKLAGVKQRQIADALNTSRENINAHINGRRRNQRVQEGIAAALGVPVDELFPENGQDGQKSN